MLLFTNICCLHFYVLFFILDIINNFFFQTDVISSFKFHFKKDDNTMMLGFQ